MANCILSINGCKMKVAVFGGTGFIGSYLTETLLEGGHEVCLLVRPGSGDKIPAPSEVKVVWGSAGDKEAIRKTMTGCQAAVYCIGVLRPRKKIAFEELHFRVAKRVMGLAQELKMTRFLLVSALGVKPEGTLYQTTKFKAEEYLKTTCLNWTIFRPALVFGPPRGRTEFCTQLHQDLIATWLPVPLFFSGFKFRQAGKALFTPIHVRNVAQFISRALVRPDTFSKTIELGGVDTFRWKDLIQVIAGAVDKQKWTVPVPAWALYFPAAGLDRFSWFPLTRSQLQMLLEGNACDSRKLYADFGLKPRRFRKENLRYLTETEVP